METTGWVWGLVPMGNPPSGGDGAVYGRYGRFTRGCVSVAVSGRRLLLGGRCGSMLKTMVRRVGLAAAACAVVAPLGLLPSSPAFAEGGGVSGNSSQNADGGVDVSVSVSYTSATPGSGGSSGTTTSSRQFSARVKPPCQYLPVGTGDEVAKNMDGSKTRVKSDPDEPYEENVAQYPGWAQHAGDTEGRWYLPSSCSQPDGMSKDEYNKIANTFLHKPAVFVPAGGQPPVPPVDGATLAKAAWKAVEIPAPSVEMNPRMDGDVQTLVGVENWVWASADTPQSVTATASAGPVSATVTATSSGLTLSAPDSKVSCQGFGTPWQPGMPEGSSSCTMTFTRSSEHLGGSTSVKVGVSYSASYTASDGAQGSLPSVSTSGSVSLKVGEAQSLNSSTQN